MQNNIKNRRWLLLAGWQQASVRHKGGLIKLLPGLLLLLPELFCSAQIRQAQIIARDPFLVYIDSRFDEQRPKLVLQALEKESSTARNIHDRAVARSRSLALAEAERLWLRSIEKDASLLYAYLNLSRLYFLLGEDAAMQRLYHRLIQIKNFTSSRLYTTADQLYRTQRLREGLLLMQILESEARDTNCPPKQSCFLPAAFWLADYYFAEPNYTKTYYYYKRILAARPRHSQALWGLGRLAYLAGEWKKAIAYLKLAEKYGAARTQKRLHYLLADAYYQQKDVGAALKQIKKIPRKQHTYRSLCLYGDLLITKNFQADLSPILNLRPQKHLRSRLLRHWYGTENIRGLECVHSSLFLARDRACSVKN